jgi:hypothetical protein
MSSDPDDADPATVGQVVDQVLAREGTAAVTKKPE